MVEYLETISKPRNMTVEAFVNRVKVMVRYINDIPFTGQNPPTINQTKLKIIIFRAMPSTWQTHFLRVHDVATITVLQLQQFMSQEREFAEPQNDRGNSGPRRHSNRDSRPIQNSGNNHRTGRGGGRNNYAPGGRNT